MAVEPGTASIVVAAIAAIGSGVTAWMARRVHHEVTANHHASKRPTLPDRMDDVGTAVERLDEKFDDYREDFAEHRSDVAREFVRVWEAINEKADRPRRR